MSSSAAGSSQHEGGRPVVVVGVDGSAASKDALRWAADYAALFGGEVRAVTAWQWPVSMGMAMPLPEDYNPLDDARAALEKTLAEVLGDSPSIPVTTQVIEGAPAVALVSESHGAALLVVGSRGHGGFAGLLLGSTSEHCARHASCPVVVVRHQVAAGG
jgi:nucleotide-binding universal stress UspA family protein